jgi:hypothetical protein
VRGVGARLKGRFGGVQVRSDLALTVGLVLAGVMIVAVAVFAAVAVARLVT